MSSIANKVSGVFNKILRPPPPPPPALDQMAEKKNVLYNLEEDFEWSQDHNAAYSVLWEKFGDSWFQKVEESLDLEETEYDNTAQLRFVNISDTHGKHRALSANNLLPPGDVIIHAGDFTNTGEISQIKDFCDWFGSLPYKYKIVIGGNHDLSLDKAWYKKEQNWTSLGLRKRNEALNGQGIDLMRSCKNITYLEDSAVNVEGYTIFGSPYQPEFCNWAFNLERGEKCDEKWKSIPENTDILITHGPPLGHGDKCMFGGRAGCLDLLRHVQKRVKPKYHIFGHIHEGYGSTTNGTTTFINASSCNFRYRPLQKPIVFDLPIRTTSASTRNVIKNKNSQNEQKKKTGDHCNIAAANVRLATPHDFQQILAVINEASIAYKGVVDEYTEPYMPRDELINDMENAGIRFYVAESLVDDAWKIVGVMGIQPRSVHNPHFPADVTLIRHAYTRTAYQGRGIGSTLLAFLVNETKNKTPILVGTWAKGEWAIKFYEKHGFKLIDDNQKKNQLLRTYWFCEGLGTLNDPASEHRKKQIEASVVLGDAKWYEKTGNS